MWSTFRDDAGIPEGGRKMSDEDRKLHAKANEDAEETGEDVEAHVKHGRDANDEGGDDDGGDDVEAHVKHGRD
jgi:hypothetical protein